MFGRTRPAPLAQILQTAAVFAALGDETRLSLLHRLSSEGPLSITRLAEGGGITRQAVTKHLDVLESAGLAASRRQGRERVWELDAARLHSVRRALDRLSALWDARLDRLRRMVED